MIKFFKILQCSNTGSIRGTSQSEWNIMFRLTGDKRFAKLYFTDRGNNAEYESFIDKHIKHSLNEDDKHMVYIALDEYTDKIEEGQMFMLDYEQEIVIPITFTNVFKEELCQNIIQ